MVDRGRVAALGLLAVLVLVPEAGAAKPSPRVLKVSSPPEQMVAGSSVRVTVRVRTRKRSTLRLRLSKDAKADSRDRSMGNPRRLRARTTSRRVTARISSSVEPGRYRVIACVRRSGARGRGHCRASRRFEVLAAPPAVPAPPPRRTPIALGTSIKWACVDRTYDGPPGLKCPLAHDSRYEAAARRFHHFVPENEMKPPVVHRAKGMWDFALPDQLVAWARGLGRPVRGHTLVWGKSIPAWMKEATWTRESLLAELRAHVVQVMRHYKAAFPGVVTTWDVVNEPFEADGRMEDNLYHRVTGRDYVEQALIAARFADPDAFLVLNEYGAELPGTARAEALYAMVVDFRRRGIPIDAVGLQMHVVGPSSAPTFTQLQTLLRRYAQIGVAVEITELDSGTTRTPAGVDPLAAQAAVMRTAGRACYFSSNCARVTVWGVADPYSWRDAERPLPLGANFAEKPAWGALRAALGHG